MSEETNKKEQLTKQDLLLKLTNAEELYALMSLCTKSPYVACDEETFDDEATLFFDEERAKEAAKELMDQMIPVSLAKLNKTQLLPFFTNLYSMGVNALRIRDTRDMCIQLNELVKRRDPSELPEGMKWIENPSLHLTMLYYAQELRRPANKRNQELMDELQEEINAHFREGEFLFAIQKEDKGTPLMKADDGNVFQPAFTDILEFQKFNREDKFRPVVVEAASIARILSPESTGVILNPLGANVPMSVNRTKQ